MMEQWESAKLHELVTFVIGGDWGEEPSIDHDDYVDVYCIRGTELRDWHTERGRTAAHRKIKRSSLEKRQLREGDLILEASGGGPQQPVGRVERVDRQALAENPEHPKTCTNFFRRLEITREVDSSFLTWYLKHFYQTGAIDNYQAGSNNLRNLKYPEYEQLSIPLPPLNEQRRIVEKIETLFALLDQGEAALREVQTLLVRYRQSVLKAAVTGELTADWRGHGGNHNWKVTTLGALAEYLTSGSRGWAEFYSDSGDIFIRAQNLKHDRLDLDDIAYVVLPSKSEGTRTRVSEGDLLITITGANVTKSALVEQELGTAYVSQHVALFRPTKEIDPEFLYWFVIAEAGGRKQLETYAYGAGKPGLNLQNIREIRLSLPPLEEQREIVQRIRASISRQEAVLEEVARQLQGSFALRQSILRNAFAGRLVPQDPNDEPASELLARIRSTRKVAPKKKTTREKAKA